MTFLIRCITLDHTLGGLGGTSKAALDLDAEPQLRIRHKLLKPDASLTANFRREAF